MTTIPPVLHRSARAITPNEFLEALQATCVPRFPQSRGRTHRPIALAVSGGVDSMALAYLCTKIRQTDEWFKVADHPVSNPFGLIVDHGLREGSAEEANNVAVALQQLRVRPYVLKARWNDVIAKDANPNNLPNVETVARYLRYRRLGAFCRGHLVAALLTAHHEDDQYETVMMRLLSGHGYRGLQGMRPATDIPECYDLHGVYQSGFVDDQRRGNPLYNLTPTHKDRGWLKRGLRNEVDPAILAREVEAGLRPDLITATYLDDYDGIVKGSKRAPRLAPLELEDGGVMVYRPLLRFPKDRLIATCLENGIPWFEDHTNADQTLTMRNAVRYMHKNHTLPVALQKPSILRLSERCRAKVASAEAEADRLLSQVLIHEFGPNTGTVVVTLPHFSLPTASRKSASSPASRQRRIDHYRHIAALVLRKLLSMVTPERELSQPSQLAHLVSMLFPSLPSPLTTPPPPPKPYVVCGVHFTPLLSSDYHPIRWFLSRAPHVSSVPRPSLSFSGVPFTKRFNKPPSAWKTLGWTDTELFDGRYWVRLLHRLPCHVRVAPFEAEHYKPFRETLAEDDDEGYRKDKELAAILRRYAPGKTRYTLPAIYSTVNVSGLLRRGKWWPKELEVLPLAHDKAQAAAGGGGVSETRQHEEMAEIEVIDLIRKKGLGGLAAARMEWEQILKECDKPQLLALPTLGIGLPGLEEWLRWEVRYRKVDVELLRLSKFGGRRIGRRELRRRVRWFYRWTRRERKGVAGMGR
ncbi:adenine nucleotide alpha hydrolases-like protein [Parathielavia appendiculata]|uniref:tRNA(Ile)-lysidine synthetase n=1 Tax=Parathielavia appendiculata TaxID=2587402 RepID=A0AAN6TQF2_9PEZI|nr:adenine nucleotide alpha hydrolases-like protein [Parathielavia appendiculata]